MKFDQNITKILTKYNSLGDILSTNEKLSSAEFIQYSKEYAELTPIVKKIVLFQRAASEMAEAKKILDDPNTDTELKDLAEEELYSLKEKLPLLEHDLKISLLPKDVDDTKNAIIEVRAGTGGEEAALFAGILFRMYQRYAERNRWKFEILSIQETGKGGIKEASATINGTSVFAKLKFESGVHRVQRVPETEANGRVHTSAATVAVLPEAEEVDIELQEKDLRIDVFRASGAGGQHVNTTESAVRIVHIPTGIMVQQQDEKSQHKNKARALKILRAKIYELQRAQKEAERAAQRKEQVGSGDRSERIRTYNFPQSRVTDHRINKTLYNINEIISEGKIDELIEGLITDDEAKRLAQSIV